MLWKVSVTQTFPKTSKLIQSKTLECGFQGQVRILWRKSTLSNRIRNQVFSFKWPQKKEKLLKTRPKHCCLPRIQYNIHTILSDSFSVVINVVLHAVHIYKQREFVNTVVYTCIMIIYVRISTQSYQRHINGVNKEELIQKKKIPKENFHFPKTKTLSLKK